MLKAIRLICMCFVALVVGHAQSLRPPSAALYAHYVAPDTMPPRFGYFTSRDVLSVGPAKTFYGFLRRGAAISLHGSSHPVTEYPGATLCAFR